MIHERSSPRVYRLAMLRTRIITCGNNVTVPKIWERGKLRGVWKERGESPTKGKQKKRERMGNRGTSYRINKGRACGNTRALRNIP